MARQKITFAQLEAQVGEGLHLASFLVVEPDRDTPANAPREMFVDVCNPSRLEDGQAAFYEIVIEPHDLPKVLAKLKILVGIAKSQWANELDTALAHACIELQS